MSEQPEVRAMVGNGARARERQAAGLRLAELMADAMQTPWQDHEGVAALVDEARELLDRFEVLDDKAGGVEVGPVQRRLKLALDALKELPEGCREATATLWAVITIELARLDRMRRRGRSS